MPRHRRQTSLVLMLLVAASVPARAASECQPVFDAYAAQKKVPALKKTVVTPGMATPVELILTQQALYSRVGTGDAWSKIPLDDATRAVMAKGYPTPETISDCRRLGPQDSGGVAATAYQFTPSEALGNAPGERLTVLIGTQSGLPLSETAAKAGTKATLVYDGVVAPLP